MPFRAVVVGVAFHAVFNVAVALHEVRRQRVFHALPIVLPAVFVEIVNRRRRIHAASLDALHKSLSSRGLHDTAVTAPRCKHGADNYEKGKADSIKPHD